MYACVEILHITGHPISVTLSFDDFSVVSQFYGCLLAKILCASWYLILKVTLHQDLLSLSQYRSLVIERSLHPGLMYSKLKFTLV